MGRMKAMSCECGEEMLIPLWAYWNPAWQLLGGPGAYAVVCPSCQVDNRIAAALADSIRAAQCLILYTDPEQDSLEDYGDLFSA